VYDDTYACPQTTYVYQYVTTDPNATTATIADASATPDDSAIASDGAVAVTAGYPPEASELTGDGLRYYNAGRQAFQSGDFSNAMRLASHAGVEAPQNARVHELMSLALLGAADYRSAATEAHAALALGTIADWPALLSYFNSAEKYSSQLRTLEKYVGDNPGSAPARFLLGYHYLMTNHRDEAKKQLTEALKLTPKDKLAAHLVGQLEANQPITPPTAATPTPPTPTPTIAPPANPPATSDQTKDGNSVKDF
jgi:tetratricopeptide (TPR) repeat protein